MSTPAIRACYLRELIQGTARLGSAREPVVRDAARALAATAALEPLDWAPMGVLVDLAQAVLDAAGPEGVRQWAMESCLRAMDQALFRPYLDAARAAGFDPATLIDHGCKAARVHFAGCGDFALVSSAEDGASVVQYPVPDALRTRAYLETTAGMIQAFPVACGLDASITVQGGADAAVAEYHLGWWVPGAA